MTHVTINSRPHGNTTCCATTLKRSTNGAGLAQKCHTYMKRRKVLERDHAQPLIRLSLLGTASVPMT